MRASVHNFISGRKGHDAITRRNEKREMVDTELSRTASVYRINFDALDEFGSGLVAVSHLEDLLARRSRLGGRWRWSHLRFGGPNRR